MANTILRTITTHPSALQNHAEDGNDRTPRQAGLRSALSPPIASPVTRGWLQDSLELPSSTCCRPQQEQTTTIADSRTSDDITAFPDAQGRDTFETADQPCERHLTYQAVEKAVDTAVVHQEDYSRTWDTHAASYLQREETASAADLFGKDEPRLDTNMLPFPGLFCNGSSSMTLPVCGCNDFDSILPASISELAASVNGGMDTDDRPAYRISSPVSLDTATGKSMLDHLDYRMFRGDLFRLESVPTRVWIRDLQLPTNDKNTIAELSRILKIVSGAATF